MTDFVTILSDWVDTNHPTWCIIEGAAKRFWFIKFKRTGRAFFEIDKLNITGIESGMSFTYSKINDSCDFFVKGFKTSAADPRLFDKLTIAMIQIEHAHLEPINFWRDFSNKRQVYKNGEWHAT